MNRGPYPETRGSHLAGVLERQRAAKARRRGRKRKQKAAKQMGATMTINGSSSNGAIRPPTMPAEPAPKQRRRARAKNPLTTEQREVLLGAIAKRGRDQVCADMMRLDVNRGRNSVTTFLRNLESRADYSWSSTSWSLFDRLVKLYRAGGQATLPEPKLPLRPPPLVPAAPPPVPSHPSALALSVGGAADPNLINTIATTVAVVLAALQGGGAAPKLPAHMPQATETHQPEPETGIKQFDELPTAQQRKILNSMHSRYGSHLKEHCGIITGEHGAAWDLSYEAYDRETGERVREAASAQSDSTATRVKPLDIIEQRGDLVRFWRIVRTLWERGA